MEKYQFDKTAFSLMENSCVPFAVYQFIDRRVVTLALSAGFMDLFAFDDRAEAYYVMDNDMYRDSHPDDVARIADAALRFATEGGEYNVIYRTMTRRGYRVVRARGKHVYTETGVRLAVVWYTDEGPYLPEKEDFESRLERDFNRALHEDSLYHRANYDFLTGLPSMTYFFELANAARNSMLERGEQPALLFVDLCGMRFYNEKYGFSEGDELIKAVAKVLVRHFSNERCSRFGQDHFAVATQAEGLEDTLGEIFEECKDLNGGRSLPVRVGIYLVRGDSVDVSTACDRAKAACDADRDSYLSSFRYFDESFLAENERRQYYISHLDQAIRERWIRIYYQPIIRAANGRVSDEEALARWIDPERGVLSPAEFIPVLEDARLINKLDLYVLEQVLEKVKAQAAEGLYVVPTSVNLSRADFDTCDIVEEIRRRVDESGLGRDMINVEITESVIGRDYDFMKRQIERFRELGFGVWMDDFGSGYSSLDLLQSIRFDLIKFDARFMQQFDQTEKNRIILTELIKMTSGLGIESVVEGVETAPQVDFLREVGATKLQGFYYCKPISKDEIFHRYRTGTQIGFENPAESEYYAALGRINLYDMAVVANEDILSFRHYFDTLPMAVIETDGSYMAIVRSNKSYREFMTRQFGIFQPGVRVSYEDLAKGSAVGFLQAFKRCGESGGREILDEVMPDGSVTHTFIRLIAENPVTGVKAWAVAVLSVTDGKEQEAVTYAHIAQALAADYINLYYVDLDTERFIEYRSEAGRSELAVEQRGENFFQISRELARERIYEEDRPAFLEIFTRENVLQALADHGTFTLTYRLLVDGAPVYVNMKATRMQTDSRHIIIGVNNVDVQMRHQEILNRLREEETTYARITALSGDYICIYTVDPETDHYFEYNATRAYEGLGLAKEGEHFFDVARRESLRTIFPEDLELLQMALTKANVMRDIQENGVFLVNYRLMIDGEPRYVCLKAALVEEKDGPKLIIGVSDVDSQVRRDQELTATRAMVNIDALTGVKNKHAYVDFEEEMDKRIQAGEKVEFAVLVFDVNDLKSVNDTYGHQAGDQYLKEASAAICEVFAHSPVYRVGGDEFVVIARGRDYLYMDELVARLAKVNADNSRGGSAVVACGGARFRYKEDDSVADVFERADVIMYEDKKRLKGE